MREKLIELVKQGIDVYCNSSSYTELQEVVADHLIANGVEIVVQCKDCKNCEYTKPTAGARRKEN